MGDGLKLAVGFMGNAASFLLFAAPILTFSRVIKKKSTEEFSCIPYIISLFNCLNSAWYGLPIVSSKWENIPIITTYGSGVLLEASFTVIYFWFATTKGKKKVVAVLIPALLLFCAIAVISALLLHEHHERKLLVGGVGVGSAIIMYGSPLVAMRQVIRTKSVEYMPFYLSFFSFTASVLWSTYGLLARDMIIAIPNIASTPIGLLQLVLYCKYRKSNEIADEPNEQMGNGTECEEIQTASA